MPKNKPKSRLEIFDIEQINWIRHSWHKDAEHAIINADVIARSRNCRARVISGGNIVYEAGGNNGR